MLWHVTKVACDVRTTPGTTVRSFNESVLNEHIESITFSEINNEDEGKVTSMDERSFVF
jgi:hypothetical protein